MVPQFEEQKHPRGQSRNKGQFAQGHGQEKPKRKVPRPGQPGRAISIKKQQAAMRAKREAEEAGLLNEAGAAQQEQQEHRNRLESVGAKFTGPATSPQVSLESDPYAGHPFRGLPPDKVRDKLLAHSGYQSTPAQEAYHAHLNNVQVPDEQQHAQALSEAVRQHTVDNPLSRMPIPDAAKAVPSLKPVQVQALVRKMSEQGQIRSHPWTGAMYQVPDDHLPYMLPMGQELRFYLEHLPQASRMGT